MIPENTPVCTVCQTPTNGEKVCEWCQIYGECDYCEFVYDIASVDDHCGECGCCFDHCHCDGGPNPHVRALEEQWGVPPLFRITIQSMRERYVYEIFAANAEQAELGAKLLAQDDGWRMYQEPATITVESLTEVFTVGGTIPAVTR